MRVEQYRFTGSDESYTYPALITPIIHFLKKRGFKTIWCPFDSDKSFYPKLLRVAGFDVINTHTDFYKEQPDREFDAIVSNPPFTNKKQIFERAMSFNKPFALVAPASWINDGGVNNVFDDKKLQLFIPDKRPRFYNEQGECIGKQPSFKAIYYCYGILDRQIEFFEYDRRLEVLSKNI